MTRATVSVSRPSLSQPRCHHCGRLQNGNSFPAHPEHQHPAPSEPTQSYDRARSPTTANTDKCGLGVVPENWEPQPVTRSKNIHTAAKTSDEKQRSGKFVFESLVSLTISTNYLRSFAQTLRVLLPGKLIKVFLLRHLKLD